MKDILTQLARETGEFALQALQGGVEKAVLQQTAQTLNARLTELQLQAQTSPGLLRIWEEARRYLDAGVAALQPAEDTLAQQVSKLSHEAFILAQQTALGQPDLHKKARNLDQQLKALSAQVQALPSDEQPAVNQSFTDAHLDIAYVLANGKRPTSIRLFHFLQDQTRT